MVETYYVATDASGTGRDGEDEWQVHLSADGNSGELDKRSTRVVLADASALLDRLDEIIFTAEAVGQSGELGKGLLASPGAHLLRRTPWDTAQAARFALVCVEHALDDSADVKLPSGMSLGEVVADAKAFLDHADAEEERRLGRLARLATARRLRRSGEQVGDLARALLAEDVTNELDASDDPAWTLAASVVDAVLAAVEALRHVAFPRYVTEREEVAGERDEQVGGESVPRFFTSPWGNFAVGAEHESPYMPASHLAREAAFRARQSVHERGGEAAAAAERAWQRTTLEALLAARP